MRGTIRRTLQSLSAAAFFFATAGAAWACSEAIWYGAVPEDGAQNVPLNARVSLLTHMGQDEQLALHKVMQDGTLEEVPTTRAQRANRTGYPTVTLEPLALLEPDTEYVLTAPYSESVTRFTTGTQEDHTPPAVPTFELGEVSPYTPRNASGAGARCYTDTGFIRYRAQSEGAATFTFFEDRSIVATGLPPEGSLQFQCPNGARTWAAEVVAVDLAGNASEPLRVTIEEKCVPDSFAYGCSATGASAPMALLTFGTAALLYSASRRRRSRTTPTT